MSYSQNTNIQSEINKMKAEIMLDEIIIKYNFIKYIDTEENIIKKIIELNLDENAIIQFYDINKIYEEFEDDYGISGFIPEDVAKEKIKELHCDRVAITNWIEDDLLGGN